MEKFYTNTVVIGAWVVGLAISKVISGKNNEEYSSEHFKIKSNDESLDEDKQFEFDVWYNPKNNLILKVTYNKMGNWEYRLRSFE